MCGWQGWENGWKTSVKNSAMTGLGWANGWVLFECAHYLPAGYELGKLFQNPQLTHNVPTGYIALCPQCPFSSHAKLCLISDTDHRVDLCRRKRGSGECPMHAPGGIPSTSLGDSSGERDVPGPCRFAANAVFCGGSRRRNRVVAQRGAGSSLDDADCFRSNCSGGERHTQIQWGRAPFWRRRGGDRGR